MPERDKLLHEGPAARGSLEAYYTQPELWEMERYESQEVQRLRARVIPALIDPEVESILDVGCGNGFITRNLRASKRVVGFDPSEEALSKFDGECILGTSTGRRIILCIGRDDHERKGG